MYEICRLLAPKKVAKPRKPAKPAIRIGGFAILTMTGEKVKIVAKHPMNNSYYVENMDGNRLPFSMARDVLKVEG